MLFLGFSVEPSEPQGGVGRFDLGGGRGIRVRRVALAEPSLPYAKISRPVGAKSRVLMECGGEDWDRECRGLSLPPRKKQRSNRTSPPKRKRNDNENGFRGARAESHPVFALDLNGGGRWLENRVDSHEINAGFTCIP
jgi:hypothetical protein